MQPADYTYTDGTVIPTDEENIIILNQCLILGMDIDGESTIECSHFIESSKDEDILFFNNIKHIK